MSARRPVEEADRRGGDFVRIMRQADCLAWGRLNSGEIATLNLVSTWSEISGVSTVVFINSVWF